MMAFRQRAGVEEIVWQALARIDQPFTASQKSQLRALDDFAIFLPVCSPKMRERFVQGRT
jgi:hypothetical protein